MVGMGRGDVDDVDVGVFDELVVGAVGFSCAGTVDIFDEGFSAWLGGGGCGGCEDVVDIVHVTSCRIGEHIFRESWEELGELFRY
jgi:hypothetical protein